MYHYNNDAFDTDYPDSLPPMSSRPQQAMSETQFGNSNWSMGPQPQLRRISPPSVPPHHQRSMEAPERESPNAHYAQPHQHRRHSFSSPMKHGNPIGSYQVLT